jgi:hypothetical protein
VDALREINVLAYFGRPDQAQDFETLLTVVESTPKQQLISKIEGKLPNLAFLLSAGLKHLGLGDDGLPLS